MDEAKNDCVICNIIAKQIPAYIVYEDQHVIAFLDRRPIFFGHCLLSPKTHVETFYNLPQPLLQPYFALLQKVGKAVEYGTKAEGTFIAMNNIVSQSIPHFHTHIIPRNFKDGLKGFFWPRQIYNDDEAEIIAKQIKIYLQQLLGS